MVLIRKVDINDASMLYLLLSNPRVIRFSRLKPGSVEEMENNINFLINAEDEKKLFARVIVCDQTIVGMIILWDYCPFRQEGFLATWLGEPYWGKGYNQIAKSLFIDELFSIQYLEKIYLLIRYYNERSIAACLKLPYIFKIEDESELREVYGDKISNDHLILYICRKTYKNEEVS